MHFNRSAALLAGAALLAAGVTIRAGQGQAQAPAARPLVPMTAASLLRDPAAHVGENVSLMASVDAVLGATTFTVDQDPASSKGHDVLVFVPTLASAPAINSYVTVQGEVFLFDPAELARRGRTLELSAEVAAKYKGRPAIAATVVITSSLIDLAKKPIPPMTPEEQAFSELMKAIQPAVTAVRGALEGTDAAAVKAQAAILRKAYTDVEAFFKARGTTDAAGWAAESLKHVLTIDVGAGSGKWDAVKTAAGSLQQLCTACHAEHRVRMDDGTYRIKQG